MAWIEFHPGKIKKLKKFSDLRRALQWNANETLGFLGSFWGEVIDLREDGNISGWSPEYICDLTGVGIDPERVWNALVSCQWIDADRERVLVHDWLDTAGKFLAKKYSSSNKDKLIEIWGLHGKRYGSDLEADGKRTDSGPTLPSLSLPNQTKRKPPYDPPVGGAVDAKAKPRREETALPGWQAMIDHMDKSWSTFKKKKTGNDVRYPWPDRSDKRGQGLWGSLRSRAKLYTCCGIMALWDLYLQMDDDWVRKTGYSIEAFLHKIPVLVDDSRWKSLMAKHQSVIETPKLNSIGDVLKQISTGVEVAS